MRRTLAVVSQGHAVSCFLSAVRPLNVAPQRKSSRATLESLRAEQLGLEAGQEGEKCNQESLSGSSFEKGTPTKAVASPP